MDFRPVEDSVLYREGVGDADFRIRLYSIGVGSLAKLAKLSLSEFLCYLNRLRESRRIEYGGGVSVPQFGALNIARLERVMFEHGFRFRDGSLNSSDLTMLGNNHDGSPTGKNVVNAHDVFSGQPVFPVSVGVFLLPAVSVCWTSWLGLRWSWLRWVDLLFKMCYAGTVHIKRLATHQTQGEK